MFLRFDCASSQVQLCPWVLGWSSNPRAFEARVPWTKLFPPVLLLFSVLVYFHREKSKLQQTGQITVKCSFFCREPSPRAERPAAGLGSESLPLTSEVTINVYPEPWSWPLCSQMRSHWNTRRTVTSPVSSLRGARELWDPSPTPQGAALLRKSRLQHSSPNWDAGGLRSLL